LLHTFSLPCMSQKSCQQGFCRFGNKQTDIETFSWGLTVSKLYHIWYSLHTARLLFTVSVQLTITHIIIVNNSIADLFLRLNGTFSKHITTISYLFWIWTSALYRQVTNNWKTRLYRPLWDVPSVVPRGGSRGPGDPAPYRWQSQFYFFIVYNVWKNIFEIEFWFYSGWNPRSFLGSMGVYACVCVCVCVIQ